MDALVKQQQTKLFAVRCQMGGGMLNCLDFQVGEERIEEVAGALSAICTSVATTRATINDAMNSCCRIQDVCTKVVNLLELVASAVQYFKNDDDSSQGIDLLESAISNCHEMQHGLEELAHSLGQALCVHDRIEADACTLLKEAISKENEWCFPDALPKETRDAILLLKQQFEAMLQALDPMVESANPDFQPLQAMMHKIDNLMNLPELKLPMTRAGSISMMARVRQLEQAFKATIQSTINSFKQMAEEQLMQMTEHLKNELNEIMNKSGFGEQLETGCGALATPMFRLVSDFWKSKGATWDSEAWRARLQAAFSAHLVLYVLREPELFGLSLSDLPETGETIQRKLEKQILRCWVLEPSAAVRTMLKDGADVVAELSMEKRAQEASEARRASYQASWIDAEKELECELTASAEKLADLDERHESGDQSPYDRQKQILRHRQTQVQLSRCQESIKDMQAHFKGDFELSIRFHTHRMHTRCIVTD